MIASRKESKNGVFGRLQNNQDSNKVSKMLSYEEIKEKYSEFVDLPRLGIR